MDSLLGANLLARAGVVVLALGVVFFLKLAYDNGWVPIPGRVAIGVVGGLALLAVGDLLRNRRIDPAFAQVLSGGGAAIAYVTLYVAYSLPHYRAGLGLSLAVELALLGVASLLLAAYALWRDLPVLAGVAVAMAAVLVAPAGEFSTAGLLWLAFLQAAMLAAVAWRRWPGVVAVAVAGSGLAHLAALLGGDVPAALVACTATAITLLCGVAAHRSTGPRPLSGGAMALAALFLSIILAGSFDELGLQDPMAWSALGVAALAIAGALLSRPLAPYVGSAGGALAVLWPLLHFEGSALQGLVLSLLAAAGMAVTLALPRARLAVRLWSVAAAGLGLWSLWMQDGWRETPSGVERAYALGACAVALAVGVAAWGLHRGAAGTERVARRLGLALACLAPLVAIATTLDGWLVTVLWAAVALAVVVAGFSLHDAEARIASFALFGLVLARVFLVDLAELSLPARVLAFILTGGLLLLASFLYARQRKAEA